MHHESQVAQEVEEGSGTDARLYSAPYDGPFVKNPWADLITLAAVPSESDRLEVRKQGEEAEEDDLGEEDLKEAENGNCKGGRMETDNDKGREASKPTGQAIELPLYQCGRGRRRNRTTSSAASLKGEMGKNFGGTNTQEPVMHPFPSHPPLPSPPDNTQALSRTYCRNTQQSTFRCRNRLSRG